MAKVVLGQLTPIQDNNPDIGVIWKGSDNRNLICFIRGPKDTVFEGAYFKVHCHIPDKYPFEPPVMIFMTKVWHPNISSVVNAYRITSLLDWGYLFRYFEV